MSGARYAHARSDGYVPRPVGQKDRTAGPKIAHFDRVAWTVIADLEDPFDTTIRFNWRQPPFRDRAIRRALLGATSQSDFMTVAYGSDRKGWDASVRSFP